jgi:hypothetical protein
LLGALMREPIVGGHFLFELIRPRRFAVLGKATVSLLATVGADGFGLATATAETNVTKCTIVHNPGPANYTASPEHSLSGADLSGADLSHADLSHTNLTHTNLTDADVYRAAMRFTNLLHAVVNGNLGTARICQATLADGRIGSNYLSNAR